MANLTAQNKRSAQSQSRADAEALVRRFNIRKSWFLQEMVRQRANRFQMAMDEDYYDGDQWTQDEVAILKSRKQNPVVYNECKPIVDFCLGTERRTRTDFEVLHRTDDSPQAVEEARAKTHLLKYIDDMTRAPFSRSETADDCFKAGLGWFEVGIRADPTEDPIYKRSESWRYMLYDSLGRSRTTDDWRYQFRFKEVDFDIAEAMLGRVPGASEKLKRAVMQASPGTRYMDWAGGAQGSMSASMMSTVDMGLTGKWTTYDADAWVNNPRERVLLIECWETAPFRGRGKVESLEDPIRMRKRCAVMTEYDTLIESWSPYNHDRFPFIPVWCYRRKKDGAPYGLIRQQRGRQDLLNKQMSKATFRMSVRQVLIESGALDPEVMDKDELQDLASDPSAVMEFKSGALAGNKVEFRDGTPLAEADVRMAEYQVQSIRSSGGVSAEDRGLDHNDVSGKARQIRREQGSLLTAEPFDNLLLARQLEGEITLSLVEQYHTQRMVFSTQGSGAKRFDYHRINDRQPDGSVLNDITRIKGQFVIGETPWQQSLAESAFQSTMELLTQLAPVAPQVAVAVLDVVFQMHPSIPNKGLLLQRIRQATGMPDPEQPESPEQQAAAAQKEALAKAQFDAQLAQLRADVREAEAKGEKLTADAMAKRLEGLYMAAQAAQVLTMAPQIAPVADELARSVGFEDQAGDAALGAPVPQQAVPALPVPQQADGALAGHQAGIESPTITGVQTGLA